MKREFAVITGEGEVCIRENEVPKLKNREVLIKVHTSLLSPGTETGIIKERRKNKEKSDQSEDLAFGYANAGEIIEVRGECGNLKPGMRVAAMGTGYALHSNYACVPVNLITPIPDNVTYEQASYACLGATSLQAIYRTDIKLGEYGIIVGLGIVGNLAAQLSMISGAEIAGWETFDSRIDIARKCGVENLINVKKNTRFIEDTSKIASPYGYDFGIMAFGGNGTEAFNSVMKCMKVSQDGHKMGRITVVGGCNINITGGAGCGNLDIRSSARTGPGYHDNAYEYGNDYPAAFIQFTTKRNLSFIIRLISEGKLSVNPMTTHTISLDEVGEAMEMLIEHPDKALGVVIKMKH